MALQPAASISEGALAHGGATTLAQVLQQLSVNEVDIAEAETRVQALLSRKAALIQARRLCRHAALAAALRDARLGFCDARPTAAMLAHRCLMAWLGPGLDASDTAAQALLACLADTIRYELSEDVTLAVSRAAPRGSGSPAETAPGHDNTRALLVHASYWLTVTATLLSLIHDHVPEHASYQADLQRTRSKRLMLDGAGNELAAGRTAPTSRLSLAALSRAVGWKRGASTRGASASGGGAGDGAATRPAPNATDKEENSPTPAQVFRHELDLAVQQAFSLARDTIKKSLAPLLPGCVYDADDGSRQSSDPGAPGGPPAEPEKRSAFEKEAEATRLAPSAPGVRFTLLEDEVLSPTKHGHAGATDPTAIDRSASHPGSAGPPGPLQAWEDLIRELQSAVAVLRSQHTPSVLVKCVLKQVLGFINAQLFNQLLLRPECCCTSNARRLLAGLKLLDAWLVAGEDALLRGLYAELRHVRQAAMFLVTPKSGLGVEDLCGQLCPALSAQQLYRLCTTSWDDTARPATTGLTSFSSRGGAPPTPGSEERGPQLALPVSDVTLPNQTSDGYDTTGKAGPNSLAAAASVPGAPDMVPGEVLEALKGQGSHGVTNNGGLTVTFLVDDDHTPVIAPDGSTSRDLLELLDGPELWGPLPLPAQLDTPDCPRSEFEFVEAPLPLPAKFQDQDTQPGDP